MEPWIAVIIALIVSVFAPLIMAMISAKNARYDKKLEWDRQDAIEKRAAEASVALLASNERIAAITLATGKSNSAKLEIIHKLVNSNLTEAKQARYEVLVALEASLKREAEVLIAADNQVPIALSDMLASTRTQIVDLAAELVERREQQDVIDKQMQAISDDMGAQTTKYQTDLLASIAKLVAPNVVIPEAAPAAPPEGVTTLAPQIAQGDVGKSVVIK